jgi:hypothetical protein
MPATTCGMLRPLMTSDKPKIFSDIMVARAENAKGITLDQLSPTDEQVAKVYY